MNPMVLFIMLTLIMVALNAEARDTKLPLWAGVLAFGRLCLIVPWLATGIAWGLK